MGRKFKHSREDIVKAIKQYIITHKKLPRSRIKSEIQNVILEEPSYALMADVIHKLNEDTDILFAKGTSRRTDEWVLKESEEAVLHQGQFMCPRCNRTHGLDFRQLKRGWYYANCVKAGKPVIMRLE